MLPILRKLENKESLISEDDVGSLLDEDSKETQSLQNLMHSSKEITSIYQDKSNFQQNHICSSEMFESLNHKLNNIQCELNKLKNMPKVSHNCCRHKKNNLEDKYHALERQLIQLNDDLCQNLKNQSSASCSSSSRNVKSRSNSKCTALKDKKINELKRNYECLLREFGKKESKCCELQEMLDRLSLTATKESSEKGDSNMLKRKCFELLEDQEQFKLLIKEQSDQLEEYRNKYMCAQQIIEEKKCKIEALELNNKRVEEEINTEISRIKSKFQERLKELCPLPKLLENEQKKLSCCSKKNLELEEKLESLCKDYQSMNEKYNKLKNDYLQNNNPARLKELTSDNEKLKNSLEKACNEINSLKSKVNDYIKELEELRLESAKIISRNKECCNTTKDALQQHIHKVEIELAQCRGSANLMISERDDSIKRMQKQLNTLSCNFEEAQEHVQKLRSQIACLKITGGQ